MILFDSEKSFGSATTCEECTGLQPSSKMVGPAAFEWAEATQRATNKKAHLCILLPGKWLWRRSTEGMNISVKLSESGSVDDQPHVQLWPRSRGERFQIKFCSGIRFLCSGVSNHEITFGRCRCCCRCWWWWCDFKSLYWKNFIWKWFSEPPVHPFRHSAVPPTLARFLFHARATGARPPGVGKNFFENTSKHFLDALKLLGLWSQVL